MTYFRTIDDSEHVVGVFISDLSQGRSRRPRSVITLSSTMVIFCILGLTSLAFEQCRTQAEFRAVISGYVADELFYTRPGRWNDESAGPVLVVQADNDESELRSVGSLLDRRLWFSDSSFVTCVSFMLSNAMSSAGYNPAKVPAAIQYMAAKPADQSHVAGTAVEPRAEQNGRYIAVSKLGLNLSKTEAIFYVKDVLRPSVGRFVVMRKLGKSWHFVRESGASISSH